MSASGKSLVPSCARVKALQAIMLAKRAAVENLSIRLFGGIAIWEHCPNLRLRIEAHRPRPFKDFDFFGLLAEKRTVERFFEHRLWQTDKDLAAVPGLRSGIFYQRRNGLVVGRCDISYDILDFCHPIDCRERIYVDNLTLPLAELALSKLQVRNLSLNDIFDLTMLLLEHKVGTHDKETINLKIVAAHCFADWGLFTTLTDNLGTLIGAVSTADWLSPDERDTVRARALQLRRGISSAPKSTCWRLRALIGKRIRWYEDVEAAGLNVGDAA